jgi:hypothetical protein
MAANASQRRTAQLKWNTTPGRTTEDRTQALARLVSLRDAGAISEEEFAALQARLH